MPLYVIHHSKYKVDFEINAENYTQEGEFLTFFDMIYLPGDDLPRRWIKCSAPVKYCEIKEVK